jgi:hypothetical protein
MKIGAIIMIRDEEDIAYSTIVHAAEEGISTILVADNMSTDNTLSELNKAKSLLRGSCDVEIIQDKEVGYYQSRKMTNLAHRAHEEFRCDWILPFDADELFYSKTDTIKKTIEALPENVNVITADLYNHFPTAMDGNSIIPFQSITYRQIQKGALPKVAMKYHKDMVIEAGNHSVTYPVPIINSNCLEIRHFPYRTWEQFKRKAINGGAAYEATDLPESSGAHWRQYKKLIEKWGDEVVEREVFAKYFYFFSPTDNGMIYDPAPFRRWYK